jgi:hypothetical protein
VCLLACGGKAGVVEKGADTTVDAEIAVPGDTGGPGEVAVELPAAETPLELPSIDQIGDTSPACRPGEGCFQDGCTQNSDCLSGWCVDHMGDQVCTQTCEEECPDGWSCGQVMGTGPDVVWLCVSPYPNLCRPCSGSGDCKGTGGIDDVCVSYGPQGSFCGGACADAGKCPDEFVCKDAITVDGIEMKQCVAQGGTCECSAKSVAVAAWTACTVNSEWGTCTGKRVCSAEGLSDCDAPTAAEESCNGLDDDCDGDTDEATCDDGNSCTQDACLGADGCQNDPLSGAECVDGDTCTVGDHCDEGACTGKAVVCDDGDPCTDDACTGLGDCSHVPNNADCDDLDPCTVADQCENGTCAGTAVNCSCQEDADCAALEDGDLCNGTLYCDATALPYQCKVVPGSVVDCPAPPTGPDAICLKASCDPATGGCSLVPDHGGMACSDDNACTLGDACQDGKCLPGVPLSCKDDNPCTDDSCVPGKGCLFTPNVAGCDDGDICTVGDVCGEGICTPGVQGLDCDDGNLCNGPESCKPGFGCQPGAPLSCDDANPCNGIESCAPTLGCQLGIPLSCTDNNPCTDDPCDPMLGCVHTNNQLPCEDGNACTLGDLCQGGKCLPGVPLSCNDANLCTDDSCDPMLGCLHKANKNPCDDGNLCSVGDACFKGACIGGTPAVCNDGNLCTDDSCTPAQGCVFAPNTAACDDASACTLGDQCKNGWCAAGSPLKCDDDNLCTDDSCDALLGCQHGPNQALCDDGNPCTAGDKCGAGACKPGAGVLNCQDNNPCTTDSCDPVQGCQHTPNQEPCNDSNACTTGDLCSGGTCVPGEIPLDCDDANLCTDDGCAPALGCTHKVNALPCDDADACTLNDVCASGACKGGLAIDCDDANLCTDDGCDPGLGCIHVVNSAPCDDGNACTTDDACSQGICNGGLQLACDDGNPCTTNGCQPATGCTYPPLPDQTPCDPDGKCKAGTCVPNPPLDCNALHKKQPALPSGNYTIDPDGDGGNAPFDVYCDMSTDGGGWTMLGKFTSNLELHIFHPHKHQVQSATDGANLADAPALWNSDVWGHLAFDRFPIANRELRMRCRSGPAAEWSTITHSNVFSDWSEGDKGSYGAGSGWGVLRWTSGRSSHWVCGMYVGSDYPGIAYCAGPGVSGSFVNHRVSISFDPNMGYGGGTAIGCNGGGIDHGKTGQYQAEVWLR